MAAARQAEDQGKLRCRFLGGATNFWAHFEWKPKPVDLGLSGHGQLKPLREFRLTIVGVPCETMTMWLWGVHHDVQRGACVFGEARKQNLSFIVFFFRSLENPRPSAPGRLHVPPSAFRVQFPIFPCVSQYFSVFHVFVELDSMPSYLHFPRFHVDSMVPSCFPTFPRVRWFLHVSPIGASQGFKSHESNPHESGVT